MQALWSDLSYNPFSFMPYKLSDLEQNDRSHNHAGPVLEALKERLLPQAAVLWEDFREKKFELKLKR